VIRAAFLSFYRSLTRHPLYSALNLLGLSFGIAVFIVLSLFVRFETSYEQWLPNADRIYVLVHRTDSMKATGTPLLPFSPGYALDTIHTAYPGLTGTRIYPAFVIAREGARSNEETGQLVDQEFFSVFDLPVVAGDRQAALRAPDGLILTESMARKYFGRTDVLGQTLCLREEHYVGPDIGVERQWRVMAVLKDIPANSELKLGIVRGFKAYRGKGEVPDLWYLWGNSQLGQTFIVLPRGVERSRMPPVIRSTILAYPIGLRPTTLARYRKMLEIDLRRLTEQHLSDGHLRQTLSGLALTAILSLGVALINYANLATARGGLRAREMAMRRVQGTSWLSLMTQVLIEAMLAGALGLTVALSLVEIGLPVLNAIGHTALRLDYLSDASWLALLAAAVLGASLAAGLYPAVALARFRPSAVLGMARTPGGGRWGRYLREALSVVQFAVTCAFFVVIAGFATQVRHMETSNLGFSRVNLLITGSMPRTPTYQERSDRVVSMWRHTPGIAAVTNGQIPGVYFRTSFYPISRVLPGAKAVMAGEASVTEDFFKVYETPLLAGRLVDASDNIWPFEKAVWVPIADAKIKINVDVNLSLVKAAGFADAPAAVGQDLENGTSVMHIVGVVADQRLQAPTQKSPPLYYAIRLSKAQQLDVIIRYDGIDEVTARQKLTAEWTKVFPEHPLVFTTIRDELDFYYRDDRRNTELFAIGGGVAGLIGAVGLFGMTAFSTSARVHEIGIRKSAGASRWRIMRLLMFQFLRPVLIANIIAWPIAYAVLDTWLKQFDDRVAMSPLFFLAGSGLSLLIAGLTVFGVAWSGANLSPARALRQL